MKPIMKCFTLCLCVYTMALLTGCMNMATTGAQVAYNNHTIRKNVNDQLITMHVYHALNFKTDDFKNANISITTFNGEVLLAGQVPEEWQRKKAAEVVRRITGSPSVYNFLSTESPSSTLTRMSDAWLTTKIKSKLIATDDIDATQIKVVSENGTVFLMGIVTPEAAKTVVDIASGTSGVKSVVKIFTYIQVIKRPDVPA